MDHHYAGCGICPHCRVGWSQLCRAGITVYGVTAHGGHADYLKVPLRTLVALPDELSFAEGAAVACGTGTAYAALRRMRIAGGDTLAVFGQGPVGLSATLLGDAMGARVIAVETTPERIKLARGVRRRCASIDASKEDAVEGDQGPDPRRRRRRSRSSARRRGGAPRRGALREDLGHAPATSAKAATSRLDVSPDLLRRQVTLIGSWTFSAMGMQECAEFIAETGIALERIFSDRWRIEQADEAYQSFDTQTTGKGVFLF